MRISFKINGPYVLTAVVYVLTFIFVQSTIAQDIVACYPFTGNANNAVGTMHHGNVIGASLATDRFGNPNSAYIFDGIDDHIIVPHHPDLDFDVADDHSISFWINAPQYQNELSTTNNDVITKWEDNGGNSQGYPYTFRLFNQTAGLPNSNGQLKGIRWDKSCNNNSSSNTNSLLNDLQFHHIVMTKSGQTISIYVDNILDTTFSDLSSCSTTNSNDLYFGTRGGSVNINYYTGKLDDIVIFNYAISLSQINCLYTASGTTSACSCISTSSAHIDDNYENVEFVISPNPVIDDLRIDLEDYFSNVQIAIFDPIGKRIIARQYNNTNLVQVNIEELTPGIYSLRVQADDVLRISKFIIP